MPIEFKVPENLVAQIQSTGALDSDQVWVQYLCQTGPGGDHDPEQDPDEFVRPSHAAYHGQVFRLEDAPIPPLDYGCRCAIHYVAAPGTPAAEVMADTATEDPTTAKVATKDWLKDHVGDSDLDKLMRVANKTRPRDAIGAVQAKAKELGVAKPRAIAEMVVDVAKGGPPAPGSVALPPLPPPSAPTLPAPALAPAGPAGGPAPVPWVPKQWSKAAFREATGIKTKNPERFANAYDAWLMAQRAAAVLAAKRVLKKRKGK